MISLTLNSKKGTDKTTYPTTTNVGYFEANGAQAVGVTTVNIYAPSTVAVPQYIAKIGDYFFLPGTPTKNYFITGVQNSSLTISTALTETISNFQIVNIYSPNAPFYDSTSSLGYRIGSGIAQAQFLDTKFSLKSFSNFNNNVFNNSICKVINSTYLTLTDASTDGTINSYFISNVVDSNIFTMNKPFTASISGGSSVITFFQKTYNNINYQIDTTVFQDGKKYALSFSFSSSPCILNYNAKQALLYVNLGSDKSYDNNSSYMTQSNFLGYLKNNIFYSNPSNVITSNSSNNVVTHNNVTFHTLNADPANVPLIINKPVSNNLTIQILNEDGTSFQDNSNIGLMPPYVITLYFKPID